jgi:hypothetical protein
MKLFQVAIKTGIRPALKLLKLLVSTKTQQGEHVVAYDFITRRKLDDLNKIYQANLQSCLNRDGSDDYRKQFYKYHADAIKCLGSWAEESTAGDPEIWTSIRGKLVSTFKKICVLPSEEEYLRFKEPMRCIPIFCPIFFKDWAVLWDSGTGNAFFEVSIFFVHFSDN